MSDDANTQSYQLTFGTDQSIEFALPPERVVWQHYAPEAVADPAAAVREALSAPIDFPPLSQAVIPDDVVVIAAEVDTPGLQVIVAEVLSLIHI